MELKPGETILHEEPISPECKAEVAGYDKEAEEARDEMKGMLTRLEFLKSKIDFMRKARWAALDKYHPVSNPHRFGNDDDDICRRYVDGGDKVYVIKGCRHNHGEPEVNVHVVGGPSGLADMLMEAMRRARPSHKDLKAQEAGAQPVASEGPAESVPGHREATAAT